MACEQDKTLGNNSSHGSSLQSVAPPSQLGNLHKRRAETSPEKFNTGQFEPLQLQTHVTTKRIRTDDGTPRTVTRVNHSPQKTQLTAFLSNFNLTPSAPTTRSVIKESEDIEEISRARNLKGSQLTAGLNNFKLATPKAYAIPLSSIPPTPRTPKKKPFNLLNAFCANNELLLLLTSYLTIPSLISLYSISKIYHHQFNVHHTSHILAIMRTWAPHSEIAFPWRNYRSLCTRDPALRQTSRLAGKAEEKSGKYGDLRTVPTIRWLQMVVYRHGVCTDILIRLASYGHRCPAGTLEALKVSTHFLLQPLQAIVSLTLTNPLPAHLVPSRPPNQPPTHPRHPLPLLLHQRRPNPPHPTLPQTRHALHRPRRPRPSGQPRRCLALPATVRPQRLRRLPAAQHPPCRAQPDAPLARLARLDVGSPRAGCADG